MNTTATLRCLALVTMLAACKEEAPAVPAPVAPPDAGTVAAGVAAMPDPSPLDVPVVYRCEGGYTFSARYDENEVVLLLEQGPRVLNQVLATSGARYEGENAVLASSGSTASLELDGQHYDQCQEQQNTVERPTEPTFVARGNEPGWMLEIVPGDRMTLLADYGEKKIETPAPPALENEGAIAYHARTGAHELSVRIEPTPCTDDMSGQLYATTVRVRLDGEELRGCGGTAAPDNPAP